MTLDEIMGRVEEIRAELEELETADEFTDEQGERFTALTDEFAELDEQRTLLIERAAKVEEVRKAAADPRNKIVQGVAPSYSRTDSAPYGMDNVRRTTQLPNMEVRKLADASVRADESLSDKDKAQVRSLIDRDASGKFARHYVAAASDEYRNAFAKVITGQEHALTSDEREAITAVRAASLTDAAGGYAVPSPIDPTIISTKATELSPLRQISRQTTITNDVWKGVSSAGVTASYAAEAAEVADGAPTLAQPSVTPAKAHAFVPASIELSQDWAAIAQDLGDMFAEAKADLEATEFVTGDGSDAPNGIITALLAASTTTVVDTTTASLFGLVDVYKLQEGLPVRHRPRASWLANNTIINDVRQFGTANNYHGFTVDLTGGVSQLMGRPIYETSAMDSVVTTNAEILVFGDFSKFLIVDRVGMAVEYIPHLFDTANNLPSGQRGWYAYWRNGSDVLDANAFRVLQS